MSHHPERTARNVRPVNQPPSYDYLYVHQKMDDEYAERMFRSPFCTWRQFVKYELLGAKTGDFVV